MTLDRAPRRWDAHKAAGGYPPEAVYVGRPMRGPYMAFTRVWTNRFGNPFKTDLPNKPRDGDQQTLVAKYAAWLAGTAYRDYGQARRQWQLAHVHELRGQDLVCWCGPLEPCHADELLRLANG